jgi:hypothetical protein
MNWRLQGQVTGFAVKAKAFAKGDFFSPYCDAALRLCKNYKILILNHHF